MKKKILISFLCVLTAVLMLGLTAFAVNEEIDSEPVSEEIELELVTEEITAEEAIEEEEPSEPAYKEAAAEDIIEIFENVVSEEEVLEHEGELLIEDKSEAEEITAEEIVEQEETEKVAEETPAQQPAEETPVEELAEKAVETVSEVKEKNGQNYVVTLTDNKGNSYDVVGGTQTVLTDILKGLGHDVGQDTVIEIDPDSIDSRINVTTDENGNLIFSDNGPFSKAEKNLIVYINGVAVELEIVDPTEISGDMTAADIQTAFGTDGSNQNVKLTGNVTVTQLDNAIELSVGSHDLYLNGKELSSSSTNPLFVINSDVTLNVYGGKDTTSSNDGKITSAGVLFDVKAGGTLNIISGTVTTTGTTMITNSGTAKIYGGTVGSSLTGNTDAIYIDTSDNKNASGKSLSNAVANNGTVVMLRNVQTNLIISSEKIVTLDLNGKILKGTGSDTVIVNNGTLTIIDSNSTAEHKYVVNGDKGTWVWNDNAEAGTEYDMLVDIPNGGDIIIVRGGAITGGKNKAEKGGGIRVAENMVFTMKGGNIIGNEVLLTSPDEGGYHFDGGGVYLEKNSIFNMYDGKISGNSVRESGGGVNINSGATFNMYDGFITFNKSESSGAGIQVFGIFNMHGGSISYNKASSEAGVYNRNIFTMTDGIISYNIAEEAGAGVANNGKSFDMSGGTISNNKALGYGGGGVYSFCQFTMSGGTISDNYTKGIGGGVYNYRTFEMTGGTISGNIAEKNGGGIYNYKNEPYRSAIINLGGSATIIGNKGGTSDNNIYIYDNNQTINILSNFTGKAGITLQSGEGIVTSEASEDYKDHFSSDNIVYFIVDKTSDTNHQVELVKKTQLTVTGTIVEDKIYDGTTSEILKDEHKGTLADVPAGAIVVLEKAIEIFLDADVGTAKPVIVTYMLAGKDAEKYYVDDNNTFSAAITKRQLTVSGTSVDATREYDGGTSANVSNVGTLSGVISGETVTLSATATYSSKDVADNKGITVVYTIDGADKGNYIAPGNNTSLTANITKKQLTVSGTSVSGKTYDGNMTATVSSNGTLAGVVTGEDVELDTVTATYADKKAGTDKAITVVYTIKGNDAAKYLAPQNNTDLSADITPASLTVSGTSVSGKTFDGTTTANATLGTVSGNISGDDVTVSISSANFADADAGTGKSVSVVYAVNGADADNYNVPETLSTNADITAKSGNSNTMSGVVDVLYSGKPQSQTITVYDGTTVVDAKNYDIEYEDNTNVGTAKVVVKFKQNYSGSIEKTFTIEEATASLNHGENTTYYRTVQEAFDAAFSATAFGTIEMRLDSEENIVIPNGDYNLNLHGHTLSASSGTVVKNNGAITLTDSVGGGKITGGDIGVEQNKSLLLAGSVSVIGNKKNIYLPSGKTVSVDNSFNGTVGITTETTPEYGSSIDITETTSGDFSTCFLSDNYGYKVQSVDLGGNNKKVVLVAKTKIALPEAVNLTYNGEVQTGVKDSVYYTVSSNSSTNAGDYEAVAVLKDKDNYVWDLSNITADDQTISWSISPKQLIVKGTVVNNKTYDGTADATAIVGDISGIISGDDITVGVLKALFEDADIATGKNVTVEYTISGKDALNYIKPEMEMLTADIYPIPSPTGIELSDVVSTDDENCTAKCSCSGKTASIFNVDRDGNKLDVCSLKILKPEALLANGVNTAEIRLSRSLILIIDIKQAMCEKSKCVITINNNNGIIEVACDGSQIFAADINDIIDAVTKVVYDGQTVKAYDADGSVVKEFNVI